MAGTVGFDAASVAADPSADVASLTWAHTVGGGAFRLLVVGLALTDGAVSSVTWDGTALTNLGTWSNPGAYLEIWYLHDPKAGTFNIVANFDNTDSHMAGAASYENVQQDSGCFSDGATTSGTSTTPNVGVANMTSTDLAIAFLGYIGTSGETPSSHSGDTEDWLDWNTIAGLANRRWSGGTHEAGTGTVTVGWTLGGSGEEYIVRGYRLLPDLPPASSQGVFFA